MTKNGRILIVGDLMIDSYIQGDVNRISPEAPVPVLKVSGKRSIPGGAGNVVRNLCGLDNSVTLVAGVGDDDGANDLERILASDGVDFRPHRWNKPTTSKTRIVSSRHQMIRVDDEDASPATSADEEAIAAILDGLDWSGFQTIVISDYAKGFCTPAVCRSVIEKASTFGIPVLVDPKGSEWEKYRGAALVTPNVNELAAVSGIDSGMNNTDTAILDAAEKVRREYGIDNLLVTRSEKGMTLVTPEGHRNFAAEAREVFDVSGAGDTVIATVAHALAGGAALVDAVALANKAAGIAVGHFGTWPINAEALAKGSAGKAVPFSEAGSLSDSIRSRGERIVFTNGCFDIVHRGHVSYLKRSADLGDRLIVGLNSDASVRRLKGEGRPLNDQDSRAEVLAALEVVDHVIIFDSDTPHELIEVIRPDILTKGGDYTSETVVGREFAGETVIITLVEGHSTTSILERSSEGSRRDG